jgi:DNA-binding CsgD family transcriptional regulator
MGRRLISLNSNYHPLPKGFFALAFSPKNHDQKFSILGVNECRAILSKVKIATKEIGRAMKRKKLQRIRNICNLGIDGHTLVPLLLPEIRKIVPAYSSTFHWLDNAYKFTNVFDESPDAPAFISTFVNHFLGDRDLLARLSLSKWLRTSKASVTITSTEQLAFRHFYHSDFYHEILKPMGYHHSLYLGIKSGSEPAGILVLHRQPGECSFSQRDENNLRELSPLIAQALRQKKECIDVLPSKREIGLCLLNEQGDIHHINQQGRKMMLLATHSIIKKGLPSPLDDKELIPSEIKSIAQKLSEEFDSHDLPSLSAPKWEVNNSWGSFLFQANWFQKPKNCEKGLIAVTAQYCEPNLYRVVLECDELKFTSRQTEVTTLLLKGLSYGSISDNMHLSSHTVNDHIKNIYQKLGVHNRNELLPSLLLSRPVIQ